ncbi:hypothetical protein QH494_26260 [Sphingomonas sp. AR_OL41]|uniref:hypothetical protein n=1 Tax=Sphingomonas sp. AR_OL41 TaxID=3042729 RepID=UPI0024808540|nr:hypothetical protein [Sphingomonas sp. AR_OL41]MDH7975705.1 hypothetical protein [Sphingomonas sp. AR_OL41]
MHVQLCNDEGDETKEVGVGWSWSLFFLTPIFGFPLYQRGLDGAGKWVSAFCVGTLAVARFDHKMGDRLSDESFALLGLVELALLLTFIGISVFFAVKGNELTGKKLLDNGWRFVDESDFATQFARAKWSLA